MATSVAVSGSRSALRPAQVSSRAQPALVAPVVAARRLAPLPASRPLEQPPRAGPPTPQVPAKFVVGGGAEADPEMEAFQQHQASAAQPSPAELARTIIDQGSYAVLSTLSSAKATQGFPQSSVVECACDGSGRPFFALSSLSAHTADIKADGRAAVTVKSPSFRGMDSPRVTLQGVIKPVPEEERAQLREVFLKAHPSAFYVDFGDFTWFRMEDIASARFNGGFGAAAPLTVSDYLAAKADPVYPFSKPVCGHMNADHQEDSKAMVKHFTGLTVDHVTMLDLDRLGINCEVVRQGQTFKLRLPFPSPAEDRKAIKDQIVDMTKKAKGAAAAAARMAGGAP